MSIEIDKYLFKPLLLSSNGEIAEDKIIILFSKESLAKTALYGTGSPFQQVKTSFNILDVDETIKHGEPVIDRASIVEVESLVPYLKELPLEKVAGPLGAIAGIITEHMSILTQTMQTYGDILTATYGAMGTIKPQPEDQCSMLIGGSGGGMAHIVAKTVKGNVAKLTEKDVEKVGRIIVDVIMSKIDEDLTDEEVISKIKAELEYKVIEALPNSMKAGDINLNMPAILEEINSFKQIDNDIEEDEDEDGKIK